MPKLRNYDPLAKLRVYEMQTMADLLRDLKRTQQEIRGAIALAASKARIAANAKEREKLFNEIEARYQELADGIDEQIKRLTGEVAVVAHEDALNEIGDSALVTRYDPDRTERYYKMIHPQNGRNIAAVFTDNMSELAVRSLRTAFVDVFRQATIEGMTANETQKALRDRWDTLAGDDNAFRFSDRSGRRWEGARYLQMLVRTNAQRVANDSMLDTCVENGITLARISDDGDEDCPVCAAWEGRIIQIAGKSSKYPTLEEARAAGMFHPNCVHKPLPVTETFDKEEIDRQAQIGKPTPVEMADREIMQRQKDAIDESRYTDKGMTSQDARRAVTADRLERAIRSGTASDEAAKAARMLSPAQLDAIRDKGVPKFEPARKGEAVGDTYKGRLLTPRDPTADDMLKVLEGGAVKASMPKASEMANKKETTAKSSKITRSEIDDAVSQAESQMALRRKALSVAGPSDPALRDEGIKTVRSEIVSDKRENFCLLNGIGDEAFLRHASGSRGGNIPKEWVGRMEGCTFVHNHPTKTDNNFGVSLSLDDVLMARGQNVARMIAVTPKRDYLIEAGPDGWPKAKTIKAEFDSAKLRVQAKLHRRLMDAKINFDQYESLLNHMVWKHVAKQTGMRYSLIRHGD